MDTYIFTNELTHSFYKVIRIGRIYIKSQKSKEVTCMLFVVLMLTTLREQSDGLQRRGMFLLTAFSAIHGPDLVIRATNT